MKTKDKFIKNIIIASKIYHNISINWSKMPEYTEKDGFDWQMEAGFMLDDFAKNFENEKMNDSGNRNLCGDNKVICAKDDFKKNNGYSGRWYYGRQSKWIDFKEAKKLGIVNKRTSEDRSLFTEAGACRKHDLWHIYQHGRMGATLYWDKYWESRNSGFIFKKDEAELQEMEVSELETMLKEINYFNKAVQELMQDFYAQCEYRLKEVRAEAKREKRAEKEYQEVKKIIEKRSHIKRLVSELL